MGSFEKSRNTKPATQPHFKNIRIFKRTAVDASKLTTGKKPQLRRYSAFIIVCDLQSFKFKGYEMKANQVTDCTAVIQHDWVVADVPSCCVKYGYVMQLIWDLGQTKLKQSRCSGIRALVIIHFNTVFQTLVIASDGAGESLSLTFLPLRRTISAQACSTRNHRD